MDFYFWKDLENETALGPHVYQKGPPNTGGVGHAGVGWVMEGWGVSWMGGVCHGLVGCVMDGWGGVGCVMEGWGGSWRSQVGHGWV